MHEIGLCEGILEAVERRAAGRRVRAVRVRIGVTHRVDAESLDQAFSMVADGTVAQDAAVELVSVPIHTTCRSCGLEEESDDFAMACSRCGGTDLDVAGGDELLIESIEVDAPT